MVTFRDGDGIDLVQLGELFRTVGFTGRPNDPETLAALVAGSRWVVTAWDGERLVGFARAISDGVSNGYVSTVAVLPAYQRQGIGRGLVERLVADRPRIKWVLHSSEAGEGLYRALGFVDATRMMVLPRR